MAREGAPIKTQNPKDVFTRAVSWLTMIYVADYSYLFSWLSGRCCSWVRAVILLEFCFLFVWVSVFFFKVKL